MWKTTPDDWVGMKGTEGGIVLRDEEYDSSCRVTLEKCPKYYAVTCGVYGSMVHTAFFDEDEYEEKYEAMKQELQTFVDRMDDISDDDRSDFYASFCDRY